MPWVHPTPTKKDTWNPISLVIRAPRRISNQLWTVTRQNEWFELQEHKGSDSKFVDSVRSLYGKALHYRIVTKAAPCFIVAVSKDEGEIAEHWEWIELHVLPELYTMQHKDKAAQHNAQLHGSDIQLYLQLLFTKKAAGRTDATGGIDMHASGPGAQATVAAQEVVEELYENERKNILGKWSRKYMLPTDRANYSSRDGKIGFKELTDFAVPDETWSWTSSWKLDLTREGVDPEGWEYAFNWPHKFSPRKGKTSCVRRRRWFRYRAKASQPTERAAYPPVMVDGVSEDFTFVSVTDGAPDSLKGRRRLSSAGDRAPPSADIPPPPNRQASVEEIMSSLSNYLGQYVEAENAQMKTTVEQLLAYPLPKRDDKSSQLFTEVLESCVELFHYVKAGLDRSFSVTQDKYFSRVLNIYKSGLLDYADGLTAQLPTPNQARLVSPDLPWQIDATDDDIWASCVIVNTAEYCRTPLDQIEAYVRSSAHDELQTKIDFSAEQDAYAMIISEGLRRLVLVVESRLCKPLLRLPTGSWKERVRVELDASQEPMSVSALSVDVQTVLRHCLRLMNVLPESLFGYFYGKFVTSFASHLHQSVSTCKLLSPDDCSQLKRDLNDIKDMLMATYHEAVHERRASATSSDGTVTDTTVTSGNDGSPASLTASDASIERGLGGVALSIQLIQLVQCPDDETVRQYMSLFPDADSKDFSRFLAMRQQTRSERQRLMEEFSTALKGKAAESGISGEGAGGGSMSTGHSVRARINEIPRRTSMHAKSIASGLGRMFTKPFRKNSRGRADGDQQSP